MCAAFHLLEAGAIAHNPIDILNMMCDKKMPYRDAHHNKLYFFKGDSTIYAFYSHHEDNQKARNRNIPVAACGEFSPTARVVLHLLHQVKGNNIRADFNKKDKEGKTVLERALSSCTYYLALADLFEGKFSSNWCVRRIVVMYAKIIEVITSKGASLKYVSKESKDTFIKEYKNHKLLLCDLTKKVLNAIEHSIIYAGESILLDSVFIKEEIAEEKERERIRVEGVPRMECSLM